MRVLLINSVCGIRSTGRIVAGIAEKYMSEGHECRIAYGRETAPQKYQNISYKIATRLDVKINAFKARLWDNEGFNAKKETRRFIKWADNYDPDVLWLHNLHGYYINIELLFKWIKSRPHMEVRWTLHDCWAFTGHCSHFSFVGCDRWTTLCYDCPQTREYPKGCFFDRSKNNYLRKKTAFCGVANMTVVTPSFWLADLVGKSFLGEYKTEVVHNSIDTEVFTPTESDFRKKHGLEEKIVVLGVASSWGERKGLYDFVKLAGELDESFSVVLVGLKPSQIKKMPTNIICIEKTDSRRELAQIYTAADVFLNLTYEDTYPTVNLEAQACGTPCITYRTGGSIETVPEANVVGQGDIEMLIDRLNQFKAKGNV